MVYDYDYIRSLTDQYGVGNILLDMPNYIFICLLSVGFKYRYKIEWQYIIVFILTSSLPFVLNGIIFSPKYFPDQYRYWMLANNIRNFDFSNLGAALTVDSAAFLFSVIPVPTFFTISSLGFANRLLSLLLFVYLYKKSYLTKFSAWFLLLYPSFLLYSSLSLRDTLILCFMAVSIIFMMEKRILLLTLCLIVLLFIKPQNALLVLLVCFLYFVLNISQEGISFKKSAFVFIVCFCLLVSLFPLLAEPINYYRQAMYTEDGGLGNVEVINGIGQFVVSYFEGFLKFLFMPTPLSADSFLQLLQSFENITVFFILAFLYINAIKNNALRPYTNFWLLVLVLFCGIYGIVVFNFGTAARYRFPFIIITVLGMCYQRKLICQKNT
ncbi:hypothetical protein [Salinivibrio costicola]|uniref:EpsG family protein n=1 Tax=Salinivibrio costicola TaxID=51367 RepID=A0ABX6K4T6_SALCS|nr:hypothetical protein [Salinivibrio costicola]QIR06484.1 hypothetical protein HBA18_08970 [Salinivibrio costicola]